MEILDNQQIKSSKCFGLAFDASVKECKICEASKLCKQQTEKGVIASTSVTGKKSNKKYIEDTNDIDEEDDIIDENEADVEEETPKKSKGAGKKVSSKKKAPKKIVEEDEDEEDEIEDEDIEEDEKPKKSSAKSNKSPKKSSAKSSKSSTSPDMPEFKQLSTEELFSLAKERGLNLADFDKYTAPAIKRMRVTMALKKTYQE